MKLGGIEKSHNRWEGTERCSGGRMWRETTEPILRLYAGILNARILQYTEQNNLRAETQIGFRPGVAAKYNLSALQHLTDKAQGNGKQLYTCFLDLKGAYDRVHIGRCSSASEFMGRC